MLTVVASQVDEARQTLVPHFRKLDARLLTPEDLLKPGWCVDSDDPTSSIAVVAGKRIPVHEIEGVLCLLPAVLPEELWPIEATARGYVAQEMTAFLRHFLSSLCCPVLNPPTAGCLSGPHWRFEYWVRMAANAGLSVDAYCRSTRAPTCAGREIVSASGELLQVTVIGNQLLEVEHAHLADDALAAARLADLHLAAITFRVPSTGRPVFSGANAFPSLHGPRAAEMLEEYFEARGVKA